MICSAACRHSVTLAGAAAKPRRSRRTERLKRPGQGMVAAPGRRRRIGKPKAAGARHRQTTAVIRVTDADQTHPDAAVRRHC
ncbi:hypothetical protein [Xylella taiwanensis]|uniref:hypothetical protein n=1 Tax=Xylella taiwanensis TaxID=1444770 RepID=UPI001E36A7AF|nr:hypothetical protein [Xylella taiwanensis]MCD8457710.1 hypothetical protein [Xylella taiwanensis]